MQTQTITFAVEVKDKVEYLENGIHYTIKTFTDFTIAVSFYNRIRRREWARMFS